MYLLYINTNEIPGELLRENMISLHLFSHVKRSPLLWLHNKLNLLQKKKIYLCEMVWHFIGVMY